MLWTLVVTVPADPRLELGSKRYVVLRSPYTKVTNPGTGQTACLATPGPLYYKAECPTYA